MISLTRVTVVCLALFLAAGCGGPGSTPVEPQDSDVVVLIRQDLQHTAETGELGSSMMSIEQNLNKLEQEDPALAAELKEDLEELKGLSGARAQSKAKEMIEKL